MWYLVRVIYRYSYLNWLLIQYREQARADLEELIQLKILIYGGQIKKIKQSPAEIQNYLT